MTHFTRFIILIFLFLPITVFPQYTLQNVFSTTTFNKPLEMTMPTDGTDRLFVVGQRGVITVLNPSSPTTVRKLFWIFR